MLPLTDRIVVMRDGHVVGQRPTGEFTRDGLMTMITAAWTTLMPSNAAEPGSFPGLGPRARWSTSVA